MDNSNRVSKMIVAIEVLAPVILLGAPGPGPLVLGPPLFGPPLLGAGAMAPVPMATAKELASPLEAIAMATLFVVANGPARLMAPLLVLIVDSPHLLLPSSVAPLLD